MRVRRAATSKSVDHGREATRKDWPAKSPAEHREFLSNVIARIVVHDTTLEMAIIRPALRERCLGSIVRPANQERSREQGTHKMFLNS